MSPSLEILLSHAALIDAAGWVLIAMVCGSSLIGALIAIAFCGWAERRLRPNPSRARLRHARRDAGLRALKSEMPS